MAIGVSARELMRTKEAIYKELDLKNVTDEMALMQAMVDNPKLIERPIIIKGDKAIIGVSCYNDIKLAKIAQNNGANYVAFGALFASLTKPDTAQCSLDVVTQAKQILDIPIVGIGGINLDNQQQAFDAGCDAVAMINALFQSAD